MPFITTKDKTEIFYKDLGNPSGKAVVFSHGWPLNSKAYSRTNLLFSPHED